MNFLERLRRFSERRRAARGGSGGSTVAGRNASPGSSDGGGEQELYRGALQLYEGGDIDGALGMLHRAIDLKHDFAEGHVMIGRILDRLGRIEDASDHYLLAVHYAPDSPTPWLKLGQIAHRRGNLEEAKGHLEKAVALSPQSAEAHNALGAVLYGLPAPSEAVVHFERAVQLKPDFADAHSNLGYTLFRDFERLDEGARHIQTALDLAPENEALQVNLAMLLQHRGEWQAALDLCDRLLSKNPGLHEVRCNRGLMLLTRGDFRRGWLDYEARKHLPDFPRRGRRWPEWQGSSLSGKVVLVYGEQGLGDQIMFASCLPDVMRTARSCLIECNPKLEPLLSRSFPQAHVITANSPGNGPEKSALPDVIDWQVAMGSLPLHFRAEWRDFPRHEGYLKAHPARVDYWKSRLQQAGGAVKIGISWRGGAPATRRSLRSTALRDWLPILRCTTASFVSLQHDGHEEELHQARGEHNVMIHHWPDGIEDYDETAALVSALDLVITVQTAVAHLAGALGTPVWVMIPAVPEWRYLDHGERMPWYPGMRLFRQTKLHDWQSVIGPIGAELDRISAARENA